MPAIAHHHDFFWERTRFSVNSVPEYLDMSFPPKFCNMRNVVINQEAQEQLALRKACHHWLFPMFLILIIRPTILTTMHRMFEKELGLAEDDFFILQPTRVVPRKGIEQAIKLVSLLKDPDANW